MSRSAFAAAVALALSLPAMSACGASDQPQGAKQAAAGARVVLAARGVVSWQDVSAEIATVNEARVIARIPGILTSLSVREGDLVAKGQVIGRIVDSQLGYQRAALGAQAAQAQSELARVRFLYQHGIYAKARLEQAEAAAAALRAQEAAVGAAEGQGAVIAPAAGRVLRADVPTGAPVAPGTAIAVITAGPTVVRLELPESLADNVMVGAPVVLAGMSEGRVSKIYPSVEAGKITADVEAPGIDNRLIGRRVAARVAIGLRKALLIPTAYVATRYGVDYLSLLSKDGSISQVPVQTAPADQPGMVEILSGAVAGDTLVGPAPGSERRR